MNRSVELEYMREAELRVIDCLRDQSYSVGELADAIDKSQSWTSEVVGDLENAHLVDRTDGVQLAPTSVRRRFRSYKHRGSPSPRSTSI
jgi:DNA-binding MarR family transcriptional regulator